MTVDELEALLEAGAESPVLDFKASCPWNAPSFAKDILAFSNVEDGGRIVIGVEDQTFRRQGISPEHRETFDIDVMRDQVAAYADPHVDFAVEFPMDRGGRSYVVITVQTFDETPVICRRDSTDTRAGILYHRNRNRRAESAAVSNSSDMRAILELAAVRLIQRWQRLGLAAPAAADQRLEDELGGL